MKRSKFVYIIGSVIIGIVSIIFIFAALALSGVIDAGRPKLILKSASADKIYDGQVLTCEDWSIVDGALKKGHTAKVVMLGEQTNAGVSENKFDITITDKNGADVSEDYKIVTEFGTLTVNPFPLTIQSGSAEKDYDGTPLTLDEYTIESFHELLEGHEILVNITGSATSRDAKNTIADVRVLADGVDVTINYDVTRIEGDLIIKGAPESSGALSGGDAEGQDDTPLFYITTNVNTGQQYNTIYLREKSLGNYVKNDWTNPTVYPHADELNPLYYSGLVLQGSGTAEAHQVKIEIAEENPNDELVYLLPYYVPSSLSTDNNDTKLSYGGLTEYTVEEFYTYDYLSAVTPVTLVGTDYEAYETAYAAFVKENYIDLPEDTKSKMLEIAEKNGIDKTSATLVQDVASFVQGYLPYSLKITKEYTGDYAVFFFEEAENAYCQHYATAATAMYRALGIPARYTIGYAAMAYVGQRSPVSAKEYHAWVELYMDGFGWVPVEVTGGRGNAGNGTGNSESMNELVLTPKSLYQKISEVPNGVLEAENVIQSDMLAKLESQGYRYEATVEGRQEGLGKSHSTIKSFTLYDPEGQDVTEKFKITLKKGVLQLYAYEITISTGGITEVYNGRAHSKDGYTLDGELANIENGTHTVSVVMKGSQTNVGSSSNIAEITIVDESGANVTDHYKIRKNFGTLTVTLLNIEITAGSDSKEYDGTALTCNEYDCEGLTVVDGVIQETGHTIEVVILGSQTRPGRSENTVLDVVITDEEGNEVTNNYGIIYRNGTLTVTRTQ